MDEKRTKYIPALKYARLTSLYDPLLRVIMRETAFKRHLIEQAQIEDGHRVLDLGCGTATLMLLIKRTHPGATVVGIDGDPGVLKIAQTKTGESGLSLPLVQGMAFALPYPDGCFDRVLTSLLLHHLTRDDKRRTLRETFRVLRAGGELHVVDWGRAQNGATRAAFLLVQALDGWTTTADNVAGRLPTMIREAGFEEVRETIRYTTVFGTLALYTGRKLP